MKLREKFKTMEEFERVLGFAEENAEKEFEITFVEGMKERFQRYGMDMFFSPKQEEVLDRIAYKDQE